MQEQHENNRSRWNRFFCAPDASSIAVGMSVGVGIGLAMNNIPIGIAIGIAIFSGADVTNRRRNRQ